MEQVKENEMEHYRLMEDLLKSKIKSEVRLDTHEDKITKLHSRVKSLEADHEEFRSTLTKHEEHRIENHRSLTDRVDALHRRFDKHDEQEMEKYDTINDSIMTMNETVGRLVDTIDKIAVDTEANTDYISKQEADNEKEAYAKRKLKEYTATTKKIKERVIMTAVGVITVAVLGVLGKLGWMAVNIDDLVTKAASLEKEK